MKDGAVEGGHLLGILPFPEGVVHALSFSRNGSLLMAAGGREGGTGRAVLWQVRDGRRVAEVGDELDAILAADLSPDQTRIAIGGTAYWKFEARAAGRRESVIAQVP